MTRHDPVALFMDANIYLSFFSYSKDDLERLRQITTEMAENKIQLIVTTQVLDEVNRNRERKIRDAIKQFEQNRLSQEVPTLMEGISGADEFPKMLSLAEKARDALVKKAENLARDRQLGADKVLKQLFQSAIKVKVTKEIYASALCRNRIGNPPGKGTTIGDEIHWEALLSYCDEGTDLHLVSRDGDFRSPLDENKRTDASPNAFLIEEWREKKGGELYLHTELGAFLKSLGKSVDFVTVKNKNLAVERFEVALQMDGMSGSDRMDRLEGSYISLALADLNPYTALLTAADIEKLLSAIVSWQAYAKLGPATKEYFTSLIDAKSSSLNPELVASAMMVLHGDETPVSPKSSAEPE